MTIDELIKELEEIKERNREPEIPEFDSGTMEVRVQSSQGTHESNILSVESVNDAWLIIDEPNYEEEFNWHTYTVDGGDTVAVVPLADVVAHGDWDEDCICGPKIGIVTRDDGSTGKMLVHQAADGRE